MIQPSRAPVTYAIQAVALVVSLTMTPLAEAQAQSAPTTRPQRIVSINLCSDQILLDLVPRERIQAVSHLAADPSVSAKHEMARGLPATHGDAETVLGFDPDLVIAGDFSTPATVSLLERVGRRVVKVPLANTLDAVRALVRQVATAVGEPERGETVISAFDKRIADAGAKVGSASGPPPSALTYQINGYASGSGSLMDAALIAAGYRNHARALGLGSGGALPLELLLANPPDLLLLSGSVDEYRTAVADNLRHPALRALRSRTAFLVLPWRNWLCGTPAIAGAIEELAGARQSVQSLGGSRMR